MPNLRGLGEGLSDVAELLLKSRLQRQNTEYESNLIGQRQRELAQQNALSKILDRVSTSPAFATRLQRAGVEDVSGVPTDLFVPTDQELANPTIKDITSADSLEKLGPKEGAFEKYRANSVANGRGITELTPLTNLLNTYDAQKGQIEANTAANIQNEGYKAENTAYGTSVGQNRAANENQPDVLRRKAEDLWNEGFQKNGMADMFLPDEIRRTNESERGTRGERVRTAGQISGAQAGATAAASDPFKAPSESFDTSGNSHFVKWNPVTKKMDEIQAPPGLGRAPRQLPATEVERLTNLNTAEIEGVKLLQDLHKSGLEQSDNPLEPRFEKLLAKLGVSSPGSVDMGNQQQRVAFVNAIMLKGLMGGRPSQYVAQLIEQHLPKGQMTGRKLYQVLNDTLTEGVTQRVNMGGVLGREAPEPKGGMTYSQWQKMLADEQAKQATGDDLDPSIKALLGRP